MRTYLHKYVHTHIFFMNCLNSQLSTYVFMFPFPGKALAYIIYLFLHTPLRTPEISGVKLKSHILKPPSLG